MRFENTQAGWLGAGTLAIALAFGGAAQRAEAAIVACSASVAARVTTAGSPVPCEVSTIAKQDFLNTTPMTVNGDGGFFDHTDWVHLGKNDPPTGGGQSGTYDVTDFATYATYGEWMLIFKSGNDTFITGYLVDDTQLTGFWSSMFEQVSKKGAVSYKDVSHVSYYARGLAPPPPPPPPTTDVPEPASLALLGAGLLGLGFARRRRVS